MNMLVRGFPDKLKVKLSRMAEKRNLSVNQALIELVSWAINKREEELREKRTQDAAFRNIAVIREKIREKYGKSDDSVRIIQEMRDERTRRLAGE